VEERACGKSAQPCTPRLSLPLSPHGNRRYRRHLPVAGRIAGLLNVCRMNV